MTSNSDDDLVAALSDIIDLMFAKRRRFTKGAVAIVGRTAFLRTKEGGLDRGFGSTTICGRTLTNRRWRNKVNEIVETPESPEAAKAAPRDAASFFV